MKRLSNVAKLRSSGFMKKKGCEYTQEEKRMRFNHPCTCDPFNKTLTLHPRPSTRRGECPAISAMYLSYYSFFGKLCHLPRLPRRHHALIVQWSFVASRMRRSVLCGMFRVWCTCLRERQAGLQGHGRAFLCVLEKHAGQRGFVLFSSVRMLVIDSNQEYNIKLTPEVV
jgi:hypothetical protein